MTHRAAALAFALATLLASGVVVAAPEPDALGELRVANASSSSSSSSSSSARRRLTFASRSRGGEPSSGASASEPPRDLEWLLRATSASPRRREDWRDGLGFATAIDALSPSDVDALLSLSDDDFRAIPTETRRAAVKASVQHAWRGYRDHAWPHDELAPLSRSGLRWLDVGVTIVDALDTLLIVGLDDDAAEAISWIAGGGGGDGDGTGATAAAAETRGGGLTFDSDVNANVFEATIRVLGGLTSAHKLGGDTRDGGVLRKALDLAEKLLPAFKTASGIPIMDVNFATGDAHQPTWTNRASLAEVGTLVLEWAALEEALLVAENRSETTRTRQRWVMHGVCEASAAMAAARDAGEPPEADYEYGFDEEGLVKIYLDPASSSSIGESEDVSRCPASPATSTLPSLAGRAYARDIATPARKAFELITKGLWDPATGGLLPSSVSAVTATFDASSTLTLGARGDSYYEYLLKHWIHAGKPAGGERAYLNAMDGVLMYLLHRAGGEAVDEPDEFALETFIEAEEEAEEPAANADEEEVEEEVEEEEEREEEGEARDDAETTTTLALGFGGARKPRARWYERDAARRRERGETKRPKPTARAAAAAGWSGGRAEPPPPPSPPRRSRIPANATGLLYVAERAGNVGGELNHKMDHLACFLPGVLALGASHGLGDRWGGGNRIRRGLAHAALARLGLPASTTHLDIARELARTCVQMYARTSTGLAPEMVHFAAEGAVSSAWRDLLGKESTTSHGDFVVKLQDAHNVLRPETVESLYVLWKTTNEREWRDAAWAMWRAWEIHAKVPSGGYASLRDVENGDNSEEGAKIDRMESFFLGETLKYLYLTFSDDPALLPMECFVFNTEAHPLPVLRDGVSDGRACVERVVEGHVETLAETLGV